MNDPKADLQTFFTDYFTVANITNLTIIPNVERYESTAESYIRWISQGAPRYDDMGDNENIYITLVTEYIINVERRVSDDKRLTDAERETLAQQIINEIKTDINTWNKVAARTHNIIFYPNLTSSVDAWIIPMTFEFKYWAIAT